MYEYEDGWMNRCLDASMYANMHVCMYIRWIVGWIVLKHMKGIKALKYHSNGLNNSLKTYKDWNIKIKKALITNFFWRNMKLHFYHRYY